MDQPGGEGLAAESGAPVVEAGEEVGGDCLAGFDLHAVVGVGRGFDEGVDFVALLVAEEMEGGLDAAVGLGLEESAGKVVKNLRSRA